MSEKRKPTLNLLRDYRSAQNKYRLAAIDLSWMGSTHPDEHDGIELRFERANRGMRQAFSALQARIKELEPT